MSISRLDAELWALGELDAARSAEIERLRARDADVLAWTDGIRASIRDAEGDMPMLQLPVEVESTWSWRRWLAPAAALAGAAAVVATTVLLQPPEQAEVFRGAMDIEVHLVRDGLASERGTLIAAREGDRLQLRVTAGRDGALSIFDLQDDGALTEWMAPTEVRARVPVDFAVVLDDYAGSERVFVVFADDGIDRRAFESALQRTYDRPLADLDTVPGLDATQRSLLIYKGVP